MERGLENKQPTSRHCFVCGRQNPHGLHMEWYEDEENKCIRADLTVPGHFQGYPGVVHGGVVTAMLDETAGRAILLGQRQHELMVTLKIEVTFKKPTPTEMPLAVIGRVDRETGNRALVEAEIRLPDGTISASCSALIVKPPKSISAAWLSEKPFFKVC